MMVVIAPSKPKAWISGMRFPGFGHVAGDRPAPLHPPARQYCREDSCGGINDPRHLGILAFEAGRTMSRLVSLHRALSDGEVARVRSVMRSRGVAYLNSTDQGALLRLACAEVVDDLDAAAAAVARLAGRCRVGVWPHRFDHFYADLREGVADVSRFRLDSQPKDVEKKVKKMDKYAARTSALYAAMEDLADMEARERRRPAGRWNKQQSQVDGFDELHKHVTQQRERVRQLRNESLWGRDLDTVAELMARSVVSIFVRVCSVYGTFVADLPRAIPGRHGRVQLVSRHHSGLQHQNAHPYSTSGPLERPPAANGGLLVRNSGPILRFSAAKDDSAAGGEVKYSWKEKALKPPPNTLGASGLELRYAKVVALVEKLAASSSELAVSGETREELYWMLPAGLRGAVRGKLRGHARMDDDGGQPEELAGGWKEAVEEILGWLAPMAQDTVRWHAERSFEQRQLDPAPRVLALQTLALSDKDKAEAAIVELLVALSCICRYRRGGGPEVVMSRVIRSSAGGRRIKLV